MSDIAEYYIDAMIAQKIAHDNWECTYGCQYCAEECGVTVKGPLITESMVKSICEKLEWDS